MNFYEQLFSRGRTTGEGMTHFERLFAAKFGGSPPPKVREYTGAVPVTISADGTPLIDYLISGNTTQSGTPTHENPIMPEGCGELETVGAKAGQYKIPISSAGQTTPIYLGEVQSTRKIKKLVLTGEENWQLFSSNTNSFFYMYVTNAIQQDSCMNTHGFKVMIIAITPPMIRIYDTNSIYADTAAFKSYLAAQYAAGTPVCVWYVLATPETAVVNEPLMRIGDYADTLSKAQALVSIPTNNGSTTIDVDTELKPSEVYIKYMR